MTKYRLHNYTTAFPTQWAGEDQDGNNIFIRYRWGRLRVYRNDTDCILQEVLGKPGEGLLSDEELKAYLLTHGIECEFFDVGTINVGDE